jgi:hypothetical protein
MRAVSIYLVVVLLWSSGGYVETLLQRLPAVH